MNKLITALASFLVVGTLVGCPAPDTGASSLLGKLDIADARTLFVVGGPTGSPYRTANTAVPGTKQLFKVDDAGNVEPVKAESGTGSDFPLELTSIAAVGNDFLVVAMMNGKCYLVRRSDGKATTVEGLSPYSKTQTDAAGNLYFESNSTLIKIETPMAAFTDQVIRKEYNQPRFELITMFFGVDPRGNVLAFPSGASGMTARLYKADGSIQNLKQGASGQVWVVGDDFYTTASLGEGMAASGLFRVSVPSTGEATVSMVVADGFSVGSPSMAAVEGDRLVYLADTSLITVKEGVASRQPLSMLKKATTMKAFDKGVYVQGLDGAGNSILTRVDWNTLTETAVFKDPSYQLMTWETSRTGDVTMSTLRLTDNTYVLGELKEGQVMAITSEIPQVSEIITLE